MLKTKIMKKLFIILLFVASFTQGQIVNQYGTISSGIRNVTGTTLPDMVGAVNGTLAGSVPSAGPTGGTLGFVSFIGGNGFTENANYQRIDFATSTFDYTYLTPFTFTIIFRSVKDDANYHGLFYNTNGGSAGIIQMAFNGNYLSSYVNDVSGSHAKGVVSSTPITFNDGKWHILTMTYGDNYIYIYIDGKLYANIVNGALNGNLYGTATRKATIGAGWNKTTSKYFANFTGDVGMLSNANVFYSAGNCSDLANESFNLLMY